MNIIKPARIAVGIFLIAATTLLGTRSAHAIFCNTLLKFNGGAVFDTYAKKTTPQDYTDFLTELMVLEPHLKGFYRRTVNDLSSRYAAHPQSIKLVAFNSETALHMFLDEMTMRPFFNEQKQRVGFWTSLSAAIGMIAGGTAFGIARLHGLDNWPVAAIYFASLGPAAVADWFHFRLNESKWLTTVQDEISRQHPEEGTTVFISRQLDARLITGQSPRSALLLYSREAAQFHFYAAVW